MKCIDSHYIDGRFVASHGEERLPLQDPSTGATVAEVVLGDATDVERAVAAAVKAFPAFSRSSLDERAGYLRALHAALLAREDEHVVARAQEYGAVERHSRFSIQGAAKAFLNMAATLPQVPFERQMGKAWVTNHAVGVAALITPWNSAVFMICNKLAPALAAGCTVVIKPSELSAQQTRLLMECVDAAGLPPGVVNLVNGRGDTVGEALARHRQVAKVSFTGSTAVGKHIMRVAADTLKRLTLELGGKSAHILLDDVDMDTAIPFALATAFMNNGQACIAGSRLLVPRARLQEAQQALLRHLPAWRSGRPGDAGTAIGPAVSQAQHARVQGYIQAGLDEGATLLAGGLGAPPGLEAGWFTRPTVFVDVHNGMTIAREEIFGPVLSVIGYADEEEAIAIANDSPYGLQGWVGTADPERGRAVAARIEAGSLMVNAVFDMLDEAGAPIGGLKESGIGREFGVAGIEQYLETRSLFA
ncbi:aldehyde dehydrogenase family protein [Stenotrophomonas sp. 24(2023)]|uniref:aldehyde dehydrogenase family protein n=1 Tax=Stenotrophomonas sp. 24(2023) TaxID=3068324 RepID=UPI0027E0CCD4|nr:aldehyde dehydrogenase family protein [Stenotrophomonas sp. 24(2023)]WMJ69350.1 aldehyde dehydrogenase family protein [Stenotrophomonas sp. 24(2023)]